MLPMSPMCELSQAWRLEVRQKVFLQLPAGGQGGNDIDGQVHG